ncbi:MAG: DUF11 domain-containing protein [Planctomycetaceae bacterium]|nr:DUF11 domain-containing protein [Planctomycetaceae bacterium]MBV8310205.1 DUF11 domain-containing protein [Planctomycetaceae bacterium]
MSRHGNDHSVETRDFVIAACLFGLCLVAISTLVRARAQDPGTPPTASAAPGRPAERLTQPPPSVTPGVPMGAPGPELRPGVSAVGPIITPEGHGPEGPPALDPKVQLVRFQGPLGLRVEVLAPEPSPAPIGEGEGIATVGLQRGVGYRLRLSNITERPGVELFPVIEVVGHLHRPREISPAKYPIRIVFSDEELWDVVDRGRLVTKVIYLEEPEQAIPIKVFKDQIPVVTLNPTEQPLKVAEALGRVMAIVRIGRRRPTLDEINAGATGDLGLDAVAAVGAVHCPFTSTDNEPCQLPCGPVCGTPPPPGRPWLPRDEYLCDGGDQGEPAGVGEGGNITGIDPRDAVMRFDVGLDNKRQPRVLPTNRVCVYAPRFAEVRISTGTNEAVEVHGATMNRSLDKFALTESRSYSCRLVQNQGAELARERSRAQAMAGRISAGEDSNMRGPDVYHNVQQVKVDSQQQPVQLTRTRFKPALIREKIRLDGIKSVESTVMTGLVEGPGQTVMSWQPHEMKGVETLQRPGMAVIKRVSTAEAEPGDTLTFTITYRNMGNTTIRAASVVDSLLPRLEYLKGSARGPKGTVFSSAENRVGSSELKWELPGVIPPGASGEVSFQAVVR